MRISDWSSDVCSSDLPLELHIVAQIVEAQLVVGRIGDVAVIGLAPLHLVEVGHDDAGGQAQEAIDLPHPFGVAEGQIVVDGDDMDALAFERVQVTGQGRHRTEEHTYELQSLMRNSYAVFCLKEKKNTTRTNKLHGIP